MSMPLKPLITVLLGDPSLGDATKPGGRYTPDDRTQVVQLRAALDELCEYRFQYWDSHEELLLRLHRERPSMEVNPNPAWCHDGKLAQMARLAGESYSELLRRIIDAARTRRQGP